MLNSTHFLVSYIKEIEYCEEMGIKMFANEKTNNLQSFDTILCSCNASQILIIHLF